MKRNSNIELLRLILMWFILIHHFLLHNSIPLNSYFSGFELTLVSALFLCSGKPAVLLFFIISVWFYSDKEISVNSALRKIKSLSDILLFYSIPLGAINMLIAPTKLSVALFSQFLPMIASTWWFPTCYALLLLTLPVAMSGLNNLENRELGTLAAISFILNSVLKNIPSVTIEPLQNDSLLGIIFTLPLILLIKRNYKNTDTILHNKRVMFFVLIIAYCINIVIVSFHYNGIDFIQENLERLYQSLIYDACSPTSVLIAFSTFMLFLNLKPANNSIINQLSKSAFSIYLITDHAITRKLLWETLFPLTALERFPNSVIGLIIISLGILAAAIALDRVYRLPIQRLFSKRKKHRPRNWSISNLC